MVWSDFFQLIAGSKTYGTPAAKGFAEVASDGILNDLRCVGPQKPIGYLPLCTMIEAGWSQHAAVDWAKGKGFSSRIVYSGQSQYMTSAVYVWDAVSLQTIIDLNALAVENAGWSTIAEDFVDQIITRRAEQGTALHQLIAYMFGDVASGDPLMVQLPAGHQLPKRGFSGLIWTSPEHEAVVRKHYST